MSVPTRRADQLFRTVRPRKKTKATEYLASGNYPVIDQGRDLVAGFSDDEEAVLQGPAILFGDHTRILKYIKVPFVPGADGTQLLTAEDGTDIRYLFYALHTIPMDSKGYERHFKYLKEGDIPVPDLPVQLRIADILSAYDDLIENNTRRIAILEDMARRLFEEWFDRPTLEVLPDGWAVQPLRNFLKLHYGKALKADTRVEGLVPVYGSSGAVGSHNVALVSGPGIILGRKGNVGSVFYSHCDFYPIDTVFYVETGLPLHFVYQLLRHQTFSNSDSAVPGLNRELALAKEVVLPPIDAIIRYDAWVGPVVEQAQSLRSANVTLRTTRDLLLPKLISGEIEVRAVEEELETAAA